MGIIKTILSLKYANINGHRIYVCCTALLLHGTIVCGQSMVGVTGKRDTSYTTHSAYLSTKKSHPEIQIVQERKPAGVAQKRDIIYNMVGNRQLRMDVFYPAKNSKQQRVAVLMIHGGGWRSGNRSQHYPLAERLAELGYVCFTPEYRLSTEALYPAAVYDLKAALTWIHTNAGAFNIDTGKIAVAGFSAGGELAAFLGTTIGEDSLMGDRRTAYGDRLQAVIDIDGTLSFIHPESGEGDDSRGTSAATYWFGYSKASNPNLWRKASPLTHVSSRTPPTLFINSSVARMHAGREDYIAVLNQNNIYSEVKAFADAPHSFCLFDPWFEPTVQYMDAFLKHVFGR